MAQQNVFKIEVEALDSTQGYLVRGLMIVAGDRTEINEHYSTEAAVRTRLGTGFDIWAGQVDAE
jgi:hypothetical protein